MLSRFATQSCRGLSHSSKHVSKNVQQRNFSSRDSQAFKNLSAGHSSSKTFLYGSYVVAGASALGIGTLAMQGKIVGAVPSTAPAYYGIWPQYVRDRLNSTFGYLAASIGVTAAVAVAARRYHTLMKFLNGTGSLMTATVLATTFLVLIMTSYEKTVEKHVLWLLNCGLMGVLVSRFIFPYPSLLRFVMYGSGIVTGFSAVAMTAPSDEFLKTAGPLAMGLAVLLTASVRKISLPKSSVSLGSSMLTCCGLMLCSFLLTPYKNSILYQLHAHEIVLEYGVKKITELSEKGQIEAGTAANYAMLLPSFDPIITELMFPLDIIRFCLIVLGIIRSPPRREELYEPGMIPTTD